MCSTRDVLIDFEDGRAPKLIGEADSLLLAVAVVRRCGFAVAGGPRSIRETPVAFHITAAAQRE